MNNMIPFRLNIELGTPLAITDLLTLDALLTKAAFNMTGEKENLEQYIPLQRTEGVFCGSVLRHAGNLRRYTTSFVRKLTISDQASRKYSSNIKRGPGAGVGYAHIVTHTGPFITKLESIQVVESSKVYFYGHGDPDKAVWLIENFLPGIGKRANAGLGEIRSVSWVASEDYSLVDHKGNPARPIPTESWDAIPSSVVKAVSPKESMRPIAVPAWCNPAVLCVMPA